MLLLPVAGARFLAQQGRSDKLRIPASIRLETTQSADRLDRQNIPTGFSRAAAGCRCYTPETMWNFDPATPGPTITGRRVPGG